MSNKNTWKMVIEFPNPEAMLEFWDETVGGLERGDLFEADALDLDGRAPSRTYIARDKDQRPALTSLRTLVNQRDAAAKRGGQIARDKVKKVRDV